MPVQPPLAAAGVQVGQEALTITLVKIMRTKLQDVVTKTKMNFITNIVVVVVVVVVDPTAASAAAPAAPAAAAAVFVRSCKIKHSKHNKVSDENTLLRTKKKRAAYHDGGRRGTLTASAC